MALLTANNQSMTAITALPSAVAKGGMVLLATETASSSATISFTSNIDSTYKEYIFKFIDIHPANDDVELNVNFRDGGSSYDATKTSSCFSASHYESDSAYYLQYDAGHDLAQATGNQPIVTNTSKGSIEDGSVSGELWLFNPSNTTFVKHFISTFPTYHFENISFTIYAAGYVNTTTALTRVQFKMASGAIDAGTIKLYGVT